MCLGLAGDFRGARGARRGRPGRDRRAGARAWSRACVSWALLDTLEWVQRGGRIGLASAFLGTMLAIKPILHMKDGKAGADGAGAHQAQGDAAPGRTGRGFGPLDALAVVHGDAPDEAEKLISMLDAMYPARTDPDLAHRRRAGRPCRPSCGRASAACSRSWPDARPRAGRRRSPEAGRVVRSFCVPKIVEKQCLKQRILAKILQLEEHKGFQDTAVGGGMAAYAESWASAGARPHDPLAEELIEAIRGTLAPYTSKAAAAAKLRLRRAHDLLGRLAAGGTRQARR